VVVVMPGHADGWSHAVALILDVNAVVAFVNVNISLRDLADGMDLGVTSPYALLGHHLDAGS